MRTPILLICALALCQAAAAQPQVAVSIKPLQLIAAAVTDGVSIPALVMDGTQDPHHPALRPSQRQAMDLADVFVWVGPILETGMDRVVKELDADILTALDLEGLRILEIGGTPDPHVWLDTHNAARIAAALAARLSMLDPPNAARYAGNLDAFEASLANTDEEIRTMLEVSTFPPYVVYHNGYRYFESQFGIANRGSFTGNEEVQPGIRQVMAIRQALNDSAIDCIVVTPSVNTGNLDNQLGRDSVQFVSIDVLALDVAAAKDGYARFMMNVARAFMSCRE